LNHFVISIIPVAVPGFC